MLFIDETEDSTKPQKYRNSYNISSDQIQQHVGLIWKELRINQQILKPIIQ